MRVNSVPTTTVVAMKVLMSRSLRRYRTLVRIWGWTIRAKVITKPLTNTEKKSKYRLLSALKGEA